MPPAVSLRGVGVRAGASVILRDVDLELAQGESVGMLGANGAGKTTLLRVLATLQPIFAGHAEVLGADIGAGDRYEVRPRIGYVGHVPSLYPELTLGENVAFTARARGRSDADAHAALARVGLDRAADRLASACSHGMQRRAEFARVALGDPELLLLDEPHTALDPAAIDIVASVVSDTIERGGTVVVVSHDLDRVSPLVDRSVEIASGAVR
ncbi:MAG: heme ABC exporter ATP-binding protein CcmA [Acidimicrobiia bacterium]|nr:heme ABC exporter ATP-binding protein CcmA [Acidimicrobiia bacterium]